jgi:4-diphosphocytidyl-2-C-methyl-D-erythritol kinase
MDRIALRSPAKINLCLSVLGKRADGYHEVRMVMQMVGLFDEIEISRADSGISVRCDSSAPSGEANLAWKAAAELLRFTGRDVGLAISIKKNIPVAAGLAGGSGNAAAVLAGGNRLLGTGLDRQGLAEIGAGIGMDVPFFFFGPTAEAAGRGEIVTPIAPPPAFPVLLVNPGFGTSTPEVYSRLNLRLTKKTDCTKIAGFAVRNIASGLHNDLESVTASAHPEILEIEEALLAAGALGARMSGSGPTVFGVFETARACLDAANQLSSKGWLIYTAETLTESPFTEYL